MTTVDFDLTRLYQAERQEEAANDRLGRQVRARAGRRLVPSWIWSVLPYGALVESVMQASLHVQDAPDQGVPLAAR